MTTYEEERLLPENRLLILRLRKENNAVEFKAVLNEHLNYIHMRCMDSDGVSL